MERAPKENRFEFVVIAGARARQLLKGAIPRETGEKKISIAQREVLRHKVEKIPAEEKVYEAACRAGEPMAVIALGVTGGIGAYKAVEICRGLQKRGHDVVVIMTRSAARFVGPLTFEAITRRPVITSQWHRQAPRSFDETADIEHIAIADAIALLVVAPCTANTLGKFAHGIADDFLGSLYLATTAPVLLAPAMNSNMLAHPAVQQNLHTLVSRGVHVVEPGDGYLACGWIGKGRLAEPADVVDAAHRLVTPAESAPAEWTPTAWTPPESPSAEPTPSESMPSASMSSGPVLRGQRVLVTAGPTYEDIDAVRYVGNRSSGRMGFALAAEAARRGARVVLVAGPTRLDPPAVDEVVRVRTAAEMHCAVMQHAATSDAVIMAAAVADYTPAEPVSGKLAKSDAPMTLTLTRTPDILADLGALRSRRQSPRPLLIGFAAETEDVIRKASEKRVRKQVDLIVANDVSASDRGFDAVDNAVTIIAVDGEQVIPLQSKTRVAGLILDRIEALLLRQPLPAPATAR